MSQERVLIVGALEELTHAIDDLSRQLVHIEGYLLNNFRTYTPHHTYLLSNRLSSVRNTIYSLNQLNTTNKENAHLLTGDEQDKKKRTPAIESVKLPF